MQLSDRAAIDAVQQWKYFRILLNGNPASVLTTVTVDFRPKDSSNGAVAGLRVDPAISRVIDRLRRGQSAGSEAFIRDGKAEVELAFLYRSEGLMARLRSPGLEIKS